MPPHYDALIACLGFLHSAQKERGLAALFLCSRGKQGGQEMNAQFAVTGETAAKLPEPLRAAGLNADSLLRSVQALPVLRQNIAAQHAWAFDVIEQYTQALVLPAVGLANDLAVRNQRHVPGRVSAFLFLLHWQEKLAREREMVTQLAGQEWMHDDAFVSRLKGIIRERQAYERLFWGVADDVQRLACANLKAAMAEGRAAQRGLEPTGKFGFFNARIDALHDASLRLAGQLVDESAASDLAAPGQSLDSDVEAQFDSLRILPVFRGLSTALVREALRAARIAHHDKNSMFVTQGEIADRFYVILDGWVKTYKSTPEGEESILQLLGRRDNVCDHDVLQPLPSPVSARAVTKIRLLAIPSNLLRDNVARNRDLALNLLAASARRSQRLISHFEQLTLRSAEQRVGSFLLHLNLETGIGGPPLLLPFDKSLIAAYLGIKPETFSRVLRALRARAFKIDRGQITLPEPYALCDYCDADTAQKCDLAGSASCPRAEARDVKTA